ncbi:MAG: OsmC family protein [Acidobacteriia bacterium]|nr:OsmC family protein [Terriglobia bacterium]
MEPKKVFKIFHYNTQLRWSGERHGDLSSEGKPGLKIAAPPEFKGHPGLWTPEDLLVAAVEICTMTTFLAFASHKKIGLLQYESAAEGTLENVNGKYQFTRVVVTPRITVATADEIATVEQLIRDVEGACLISNSLKTQVELRPVILAEDLSLKPALVV